MEQFAAARKRFIVYKLGKSASSTKPTDSQGLPIPFFGEIQGVTSEPIPEPIVATPANSQLNIRGNSNEEQVEASKEEDNSSVEIGKQNKPTRLADLSFKMFSISVVIALIVSLALVKTVKAGNITFDSHFYGDSPPVYPSPKGTGTGSWAAAYSKAAALVSRMTMTEKNYLTAGSDSISSGCSGIIRPISRLNFPGLCLSDAGNGVVSVPTANISSALGSKFYAINFVPCSVNQRNTDFVNAYPSGIHVGASWNKNLTRRHAMQMGLEFRRKGVNVALGPVVGPIGRVTTGGRNWEGFSVDPYLSGQLAFQYVKGIQGVGVITSTKHFIANEQELWRNPGSASHVGKVASVSSNVDDKTMHELYLWPFQDALRAGSGCIMCSYNRINNSYGCQNSKMLNGILKTELGFQGFVVSDWGAQHAGFDGALAGLDMAMPDSSLWGKKLLSAINNGSMSEHRLDDMATRAIAAWYQMGQDSSDFPEPGYGMGEHTNEPHRLVDAKSPSSKPVLREGAREGHVLVKNQGRILPLKKPKLISMFGYDALAPKYVLAYGLIGPSVQSQIAKFSLWVAGGSGANVPAFLSDPFSAISDQAYKDDTSLVWDFTSVDPIVNTDSEACMVFINAYASEGYDRPGIQDSYSDKLVSNVAKKCRNTIVVIHNAGTRTVGAWADNKNVTGIVFAHLPGQDSGRALVDLLYGVESFSGKLPYTVAKAPSDYGHLLYHDKPKGKYYKFPQSDFTEGVYIDYRAFDKKGIVPQYPFGFGLTYSSFEFSDLSASKTTKNALPVYPPNAPIRQGGNPRLFDTIATLSCTVSNTGDMAAMEVAQLYVGIPNAPAKQLRGFEKVLINPGESTTVTFNLTRRDLSVWNTKNQMWKLQRGSYKFYVGNSIEHVPLKSTIAI